MSREIPSIGKRIVIWGVTGSGKTTLARKLGAALGLPVVELDGIRHRDGWDSVDWPEFRTELTERLESYSEGWVLEGSYSPIMDVYLSRCDTLLLMELPFEVSFWRLLQRTVARAHDRQPLYNPQGPTESWRQSFLSRKSILLWSISQHRGYRRKQRERIAALPAHVQVHELRSPQQVREFEELVQG